LQGKVQVVFVSGEAGSGKVMNLPWLML